MLKEQLLKEAENITAEVKLDSIFESVELSESVKEKFELVFESAVKKQALALAESHILAIAEKADKDVEEKVAKETEEKEKKLDEKADQFFSHLAKEWLVENKVEVDKSIKSDLFESMFVGLKGLFVEHNVTLPAESVDIVAEMEEELAESKIESSKLFDSLTEKTKELSDTKREYAIKEATANLTESQKEKVADLVEGLGYDEKFETKLTAIVEMASTKTSVAEKPLVESGNEPDPASLNYVVEAVVEKPTPESSMMNAYVKASKL